MTLDLFEVPGWRRAVAGTVSGMRKSSGRDTTDRGYLLTMRWSRRHACDRERRRSARDRERGLNLWPAELGIETYHTPRRRALVQRGHL
jgi:hypothetical protein